MTFTEQQKQDFLNGYLICALWSSTNDSGEPLDANYSTDDFAPAVVEQAKKDCEEFMGRAGELLNPDYILRRPGYPVFEYQGHGFWLTRNYHGAGFWDGNYVKEVGEQLTNISDSFPERDPYVGDDGKIYLS